MEDDDDKAALEEFLDHVEPFGLPPTGNAQVKIIKMLRECFIGRYEFGDVSCHDKESLATMLANPVTFEQMVTVLEHTRQGKKSFGSLSTNIITVPLMRQFFNFERKYSGHELYMSRCEVAEGAQYPTEQEVCRSVKVGVDPETIMVYTLKPDFLIYNVFPMADTFDFWVKACEQEAKEKDALEKAASSAQGGKEGGDTTEEGEEGGESEEDEME
jgi:hypothetical protein